MMLKLEGLLCVALISVFVGLGSASDCCRSYTPPFGEHVDGQFCAEYCCKQPLSTKLYCCDDPSMQAPAEDRDDDCQNWLKEHIWVPIVVSIIVIAIIVALCICCCCGCSACCRRSETPVIIYGGGLGGPGGPSNVVVSSQTQMSSPAQAQNPVQYGYDQK